MEIVQTLNILPFVENYGLYLIYTKYFIYICDIAKKETLLLLPKNIHLTEECIYNISVEAAKKKSDFKNLAQNILEDYAKKIKP